MASIGPFHRTAESMTAGRHSEVVQVSNYSEKVLQDLGSDFIKTTSDLSLLFERLASAVASTLQTQRDREYLMHGVCRRLLMLHHCLHHIFDVFLTCSRKTGPAEG
jgi:hypothetical protein